MRIGPPTHVNVASAALKHRLGFDASVGFDDCGHRADSAPCAAGGASGPASLDDRRRSYLPLQRFVPSGSN